MARRRQWLALLAALGLPTARAGGRDRFISAGEQALSDGDPDVALQAFERAATFGHHADTELRTVRALMQRGAYRQALALCAHVAGEHPGDPAPVALHAWLLDAGGQHAAARRVLDAAPDAPLLADTRRALLAGPRIATPAMLNLPHRMAPMAVRSPDAPPAAARVACTAALVEQGGRAWAPASSVTGSGRVWLRNGLGMVRGAVLERTVDGLDLALFRMASPLPLPDEPPSAARDPFAGSAAAVVAYTAGPTGEPAWPRLSAGFLGGSLTSGSSLRRLGIAVRGDCEGAPVLDTAGRFCGLVRHDGSSAAAWVPVSELHKTLGQARTAPPAAGPAPAVALDRLYEQALLRSLQVLVPA
jgi:hypothetical protein